jgi:hypothetical protein
MTYTSQEQNKSRQKQNPITKWEPKRQRYRPQEKKKAFLWGRSRQAVERSRNLSQG